MNNNPYLQWAKPMKFLAYALLHIGALGFFMLALFLLAVAITA